jgi:hypothetical protein
MLTRRSFDTLATRSVLVSLIGITLVHVLSLWFYEHALDRELTLAHETRLAERIIYIKRGVMLVATERREAVAHELSGTRYAALRLAVLASSVGKGLQAKLPRSLPILHQPISWSARALAPTHTSLWSPCACPTTAGSTSVCSPLHGRQPRVTAR